MITTIIGNVLEDQGSIGHCVSSDLKMSKGIAKDFKEKFGGLLELQKQRRNVGNVIFIKRRGRYIFYMITKRHYWLKPSYSSMWKALSNLNIILLNLQIKRIALPKIGQGLDKLKWSKVEAQIRNCIDDSIEVIIYVLPNSA